MFFAQSHLGIGADGLSACSPRRANLALQAQQADSQQQRQQLVQNALSAASAVRTTSKSSKCKVRQDGKRGVDSTIVYVDRRDEADSLSDFLKGSGFPAASYHAGMDSEDRFKGTYPADCTRSPSTHPVQTAVAKQFECGSVKVVVATIAFGMGVDKADVRRVLHACLPKTVEAYLQETGRAGRDGLPAECRLLYGREHALRQLSLGAQGRLCQMQVSALLLRLCAVGPHSAMHEPYRVPKYAVVPVSPTEVDFDISSSMIETLLSVLESPPFSMITVDGAHLSTIKGSFRCADDRLPATPVISAIRKIAESRPVFIGEEDCDSFQVKARGAAAYGLKSFQLPLQALCDEIGWERKDAISSLYSLQRDGFLEYSLSDLAIFSSLTPSGAARLAGRSVTEVAELLVGPVACQVVEVAGAIEALNKQRSVDMWRLAQLMSSEDEEGQKSEDFQEAIKDFVCYYLEIMTEEVKSSSAAADDSAIADQPALQQLVGRFRQLTSPQELLPPDASAFLRDAHALTLDPSLLGAVQAMARASALDKIGVGLQALLRGCLAMFVAKVLHGVPSGRLDSSWSQHQLWGRYKHVDFDDLLARTLDMIQERAHSC